MDQAMVDWAVTAMDFGDDTVRAEQWFKLLAAAYQDPDESEPVGGWDEFVARLKPAADRDGFDSAQVEFFVENLGNTASDPIGDVVLPMYEQQDALAQEYLELRAAQPGAAGEDAAGAVDQEAAAEAEWHWDEVEQVWHHLENNEWVPQVQNGLALNYDKTEWVPQAAVAEESASADEEWRWDESRQVWDHLENNEWVPQIQNGYALNYDRTEWVAVEAQESVEVESINEPEQVESEGELPDLPAEEQAEVEVVAESVFMDLEDAVRETDGIELEDLTENDINKLIDMLAGQALAEGAEVRS